jgi:uncharacterized protein
MTFSKGGSFEGGRVGRRRGGAAVGGGVGIIGIAAFLIYAFTGVDLGPVVQGAQGGGGGQEQESVVGDCTAEQANTDRECRLSATVQSLDAYWAATLEAEGAELVQPAVTAFDDATSSGCGQASAATGPFYCPPDQGIYMDLRFFDLLQERFGASDGPLAEMYVTAHEYGHHIQNITGVMASTDREAGSGSGAVRLELQADCYAGMWAGDAASTVDPDTGTVFLEPITEEQLADALSAAEAVGDDHIQESSGGQVDPHTWTHGSSEQRQRWFTIGYEEGSLAACDTFSVTDL